MTQSWNMEMWPRRPECPYLPVQIRPFQAPYSPHKPLSFQDIGKLILWFASCLGYGLVG